MFNASLKPDLCTQSESLLRVLTIARISESNAQLWRAVEHHHFRDDFNSYVRTGKCALPLASEVAAAVQEPLQSLEIDMFVAGLPTRRAPKYSVVAHRAAPGVLARIHCD